MGAAALHELGRGTEIEGRFGHPGAATVAQMLQRGFNAAPTSSAGRWFDAAAALLGVQQTCSFEGQAAMLLEGLAARHGAVEALAGGYRLGADGVLDLLPLLAHLADTDDAAYGAALFHSTLASALAEWVGGAASRTGLSRVAFGGGCFVNHMFSSALRLNLERRGLTVLEAQAVPPNDGGLALGQAAAAMAMKRD
jgi:hydrogenase maturation protein HypF